MSNKKDIVKNALQTISIEGNAIIELKNQVNDDFVQVVNLLLEMKGRLVVTGIGKSAIIAQKIVATFNSTGTPSLFMHAADAIHGDLGMVMPEDVVMAISKSGNSPEIKALVPLVKNGGQSLIGMTGSTKSYLGDHSDWVISTEVKAEACPNNLAPTSSTTAQMVMGDALAICLMKLKGFDESDFAKNHPGGALGKRLYIKMGDLLNDQKAPQVDLHDDIKKVILSISSGRLGATAVIKNNKLVGIITDGDLRRMLENEKSTTELKAGDIMTNSPKIIEKEALAVKGFQIMEQFNITQLIVTEDDSYLGIVHLHDILKEGIF